MTTHTINQRHRLRQLPYIPLIVAAAAVIGTAAETPATATAAETATTPAPTDAFQYDWTLAQPIYGTWNITVTAGNNSSVAATADRPWQRDDEAATTQIPTCVRYHDVERTHLLQQALVELRTALSSC
ncbi:hypothetical protein R3Q06_34970 [Rhodococcus erythropolis]|uniref:hypothetical protein n=1 Tax=Rhodococcus erythropolis TaxID=1833 RepID=UPI002948E8B8|nr:hypothetical protein [Rhodococcus erythropolis]MDV6278595.1 hypothetical protein [Rhodococcus erythropolis]